VAVERNWLVDALDKNNRDTSVAPEKSVVPLRFVAKTDVNEGVLETDTEGLCAVPPVTMFVPALMLRTYVAPVERNWLVAPLPKNRRDTSVLPEKSVVPLRFVATTEVKLGVDETDTVGFCAVPPVVMLLPAPTLCT
jgi:hypothetical protein